MTIVVKENPYDCQTPKGIAFVARQYLLIHLGCSLIGRNRLFLSRCVDGLLCMMVRERRIRRDSRVN